MNVTLAYLTVIAIWSTTPLAIRWSALEAGFAFSLMARMAIGMALAFALIVIWRVGFPLHSKARQSYWVGGLGMFGGMLCTYWGAQYVHSGLISVLFGLSPLVTSALAVKWLDEPPLSVQKMLGMALAVLGLGVIFLAGDEVAGEIAGAVAEPKTVTGVVVLLFGMMIYSSTLVALKRIGDDSPPLSTTAGTLLVAMPCFVLSWWLAGAFVPIEPSTKGLLSIVYLGIFGSVIGFALYYYVIKQMEARKVALITLVTPVLALLLGHWINGEEVTLRVWLGSGLISLGLAFSLITLPSKAN